MSVALKPCRGCPVKKRRDADCLALNKIMLDRVSGLGLRSATFDCGILKRELRKGRRISINVPDFDEGFEYESPNAVQRSGSRLVSTTIVSYLGDRFACVIDAADMDGDRFLFPEGFDPAKGRFRKPMPHTRIVEFLAEPDRPFCKYDKLQLPDGGCERREGEDCECSKGF